MSKDNKFKDEMLRHLSALDEKLRDLSGAIANKKWDSAATACSNIVYRAGQMVKGFDAKVKGEK